jgi:hypothetical protein
MPDATRNMASAHFTLKAMFRGGLVATGFPKSL